MPEDRENVDIPSESWEVGSWSYGIDLTLGSYDISTFSDTLGILRTNHAVYEEFSADLYRRTLCFSIHPDKERWTIKSTKANPEHLLHTDFSKFRKIRIEIYAARNNDPGQMLVLRQQVIDLIGALEGIKAILELPWRRYQNYQTFCTLAFLGTHHLKLDPEHMDTPEFSNIELVFLDHGSSSWFRGHIPQNTLKNIDHFDIEGILDLFQYLRKARCANVILPSQANGHYFLNQCAAKAEASMQTFEEFGIHEQDWDTEKAQFRLHVILDMVLDPLPGRTAGKLRLTRFQNWALYEASIRRSIEELDKRSEEACAAKTALDLRDKCCRRWAILAIIYQ